MVLENRGGSSRRAGRLPPWVGTCAQRGREGRRARGCPAGLPTCSPPACHGSQRTGQVSGNPVPYQRNTMSLLKWRHRVEHWELSGSDGPQGAEAGGEHVAPAWWRDSRCTKHGAEWHAGGKNTWVSTQVHTCRRGTRDSKVSSHLSSFYSKQVRMAS